MIRRIPETLAYALHVDSWLAMGVMALILGLLRWIGTFPGALSSVAYPIARIIWLCYFYFVVRKATLGSKRLPIPSDFLDTWDALIQPLFQILLATAWYWLPILLFAHLTVGLQDFIERYQAQLFFLLSQHGLVGALLLGTGMIFVPIALLGVLCRRRGIIESLDPTIGFRLARRVPWAYAWMFATINALGIIGLIMDFYGTTVETAIPIPMVSPVMSHLLRLWIPLTQARLFGGFVFYNKPWLEEQLEERNGDG